MLCQTGRVASDAVPGFSAQVVEQQHRLVCACASFPPSIPTPTQVCFTFSTLTAIFTSFSKKNEDLSLYEFSADIENRYDSLNDVITKKSYL